MTRQDAIEQVAWWISKNIADTMAAYPDDPPWSTPLTAAEAHKDFAREEWEKLVPDKFMWAPIKRKAADLVYLLF